MAGHDFDNFFMQYSMTLATKGWGKTGINPLVGAVVTRHNNIVGTGYHRKLGEMHGEIIALIEAGSRACNSTLYVNLEPCCCTGRTPPCVNSIVKAGIKRVVISTNDPNPLVNGKGIKFLTEQGIEVKNSVLKDQSENLNRWYFHSIVHREPYVIIKLAFSDDWCISGFDKRYITSTESQRYVHALRSRVSGIMVGINTLLKDDPQLTDRFVVGNNPVRIVIDPKLKIPLDSAFLADNARRIIITSTDSDNSKVKALTKTGVEIARLHGQYFAPDKILQTLYRQNLGSILLEGGSVLASQFLAKSLFNELFLFKTKAIAREGINMQKEIDELFRKYHPEEKNIGEDILYHVYRHN